MSSRNFHRSPRLIPSFQGGRLRQVGLALAAVLGWFLSLGALQGWLDFRDLLSEEEQWFRNDMVFLNRQVKLTDSMGITSSRISADLLEQIRSVPGVAIAEPLLRNHFPASIEIGGGAVPTIASEIFLEAIPPELFNPAVSGWQWSPGDANVPVLVPRQFLNLYNFGFAPGKGLPPIAEGAAMRVRFTLIAFPTQGGQPVAFTASIAGFSDQIESILVPLPFLAWANQEFGNTHSSGSNRVAAALTNPDSAAFYRLLEDHNLVSSRGTRQTARLQILLDLALAVLGTAGASILLLILLLFIAEVETLVADHQERIRKLFFLGHRPGVLIRKLLTIRLITALIPAMAGLGLVYLARQPIVSYLEQAGLSISSSPSWITLLAWACLISLINLFLFQRIRSRLLKLYQ
tara:strand:- start:637 stop:1851 length:1215 start_codon:yes stop_codon:yes gene_type:complete